MGKKKKEEKVEGIKKKELFVCTWRAVLWEGIRLEWKRCLFLWWVNACVGNDRRGAGGLARPACYRGSPGPPGVPGCWPESEGLSLGWGEESEPLPKDGWEANGLGRDANASRGLEGRKKKTAPHDMKNLLWTPTFSVFSAWRLIKHVVSKSSERAMLPACSVSKAQLLSPLQRTPVGASH